MVSNKLITRQSFETIRNVEPFGSPDSVILVCPFLLLQEIAPRKPSAAVVVALVGSWLIYYSHERESRHQILSLVVWAALIL